MCPECLLLGGFEDSDASESSPQPGTPRERTIHIVVPLDEPRGAVPETLRYFGDYELLEQIAVGGMGVVFKARQVSLNRLVAVKMIRAGQLAREDDIRRFRTEAEAAANLKHPHIVAIHEVGEHQGRQYFSMDYIEGRSLAELVRDHPLEPERAARLVQTVAEAIAYAHGRGVLHRDLKPSNVMIDAQDQPHVTDFGLAKMLKGDSELTQTGAVMGSPSYMSPEQARGRGDQVSVRSDVYALGAMLYELLTARPPFLAATALETMKLVAERDPVAPRVLNPSAPRDLETICLKCLQKEPAHRYASAEALAEDLARWQRHEPIHARPSTAWEHARKWARRHPARAGLVALALFATIAITSVLLLTTSRVTRERDITRQNLYAADVARAAQALEDADYHLARTALSAHAPASGQEELRGFEWRWLWQRVQGDARKVFPAHLSRVNSVAWSTDGRFVVSAGADGVTKLWDAVQERLLRTVEEPEIPLTAYTDQLHEMPKEAVLHRAAFSPDSRTLLTCFNRELSLWELAAGQRLWSFKTTDALKDVVFSPSDPGVALATPHPSSRVMGLLDVAQGRFTAVFTNGRADAVCFTPDGRRLARWDRSRGRIRLQSFPAGEIEASIDVTGGPVEQMTITPDGRTLATCSLLQGPLELYDVGSQESAGQLVGHARAAHALATSPDGRRLASGGNDQSLRVWDLATRREERSLSVHRGPVLAVAFSPDGRRLVSGGHDGTVRFWDAEPPAPPPVLTNVFGVCAFSPDGRWLVTQNRKGAATSTLWELPARRLAREWETPRFQSAVFTTNGTLLAASARSSGEAPCVRIFSPSPSGEEPAGVRGQAVATPPSDENAALTCFRGIPSICSAIALSPDGQFTVTGHTNGTVALWETRSGRLLHQTGREFNGGVGYRDRGTITAVNPLVFSADGRTLAGISFDRLEVKTWALPGLRPLGGRLFEGIYEIPLALSPDGRQLALGGMHLGLDISLWDAALSRPATPLRGHQEFLKVVAWSPDGRTLASGGRDKRLKLWHLPTAREVATLLTLPEEATFTSLTFSPDGAWIGAGDDLGHFHLFHAPPPDEPGQP